MPASYPDMMTIAPAAYPLEGTVRVPGSKSITNRALILAALADGVSVLRQPLDSEDTQIMINALQHLGVRVERTAGALRVTGCGGNIPATEAELFLGNSGTSMRFLTALCALGHGRYRLDGVERMRQRPQADLLDALQQLGIDATAEADNGCPPLQVIGRGHLPGGTVRLRAEASSQFLSALLMIAPCAREDLTIEVIGALRPLYVEITLRMMAQWGITVERREPQQFLIPAGQRYQPQDYTIEPDASSASYFFAAAALTGGRVTVPGLSLNALQGDVRFATEVLADMGCTVTADVQGITVAGRPDTPLQGISRDMSAISDTSLTLAAIAPFAATPTTVRNIAHTRLQECDRIHAACTELSRLGVRVEEFPDGFTVHPTARIIPTVVETYRDHRVAMSFALIGLRAPGIVIRDPGCVAKTFPEFWQHLAQLGADIRPGGPPFPHDGTAACSQSA
ncbi:MAG: 3-phosphoshikimate 1-carboxyvinyltransferase [Chloroherpetonaceae bacterium]|nr:3-phosphoshikimate 1-carboxyvinyltransferase [Chthonomonadaceae bacterium]MDW8207472.1 3-phosphoshikimate 1-carboxyvinyltransferase [Chloroherpetonaceae bacterium]